MPPKATTPSTPASQPKQKKPAVLWDKDDEDGMSSIRVILDWLATEGNYQRWRGNIKGGATKGTLANEMLAEMAKHGITHRDSKGIQTKIQELQQSYAKACDFLRGSGAGILDEDIDEGTTNLPAAVTKRCRYWDELHPIMGMRSCSNPPVTRESTDTTVPDLLGRNSAPDEDELPPPFNPPEPGVTPDPSTTPGEGDEPVATSTASNRSGRHSAKRKACNQGPETPRLDKVLADGFDYRKYCFEAHERREAKKMEAEAARENKKIAIEEQWAKRKNKIEERKVKIREMEAQLKIRQAEMDEVRARIAFMKELKELGHSTDEIHKFMGEQFARGEGASQKSNPDAQSGEDKNTSDSDSEDDSSEADSDATHIK